MIGSSLFFVSDRWLGRHDFLTHPARGVFLFVLLGRLGEPARSHARRERERECVCNSLRHPAESDGSGARKKGFETEIVIDEAAQVIEPGAQTCADTDHLTSIGRYSHAARRPRFNATNESISPFRLFSAVLGLQLVPGRTCLLSLLVCLSLPVLECFETRPHLSCIGATTTRIEGLVSEDVASIHSIIM